MSDTLHRRCRWRRNVIKQLDVQFCRFLADIGEVLARHQRTGDVVQLNPVSHAIGPIGGEHQFEPAVVVKLHLAIGQIGEDAVSPAAQAVQAEGQVQLLPTLAVNSIAQRRV